jgi:site-specific DNA recombinase
MRATLKRPDTSNALNELHRARFLLSGLMRCSCCGGGYTIIGKDRYACGTRKQKGTCDNARTISRREIEARVLEGLKERLLAPELVAEFMKAMQHELAALRRERKANNAKRMRKLTEIDRKISGMMRAIEDGLYEPSMKERLKALQNERLALQVDVGETAEAEIAILSHPNLPELCRRKVEQLEAILEGPDRAEAMDLIRSMIDRIELCPRTEAKGLGAVLHGDLAAILAACAGAAEKENAPDLSISGRRLSVVAGAGFEPATFRL